MDELSQMSYSEAKRLLRMEGAVTKETVQKAYHKLALEHHPDVGGDEETFKRIYAAYDLLKRVDENGKFPSSGRSGGWANLDPFGAGAPPKQKESKFQADVISAFEALGAMTFNVHGHAMQASGWPDVQVYHPRWTGHLECKVGDNGYKDIQRMKLADLRKRGTPAFGLRLEGGNVYVETEEGTALGCIMAEQWSVKVKHSRGEALMLLLQDASRQCGLDPGRPTDVT